MTNLICPACDLEGFTNIDVLQNHLETHEPYELVEAIINNEQIKQKIAEKIEELKPTIPNRESRGWNYIQAGRAVVVEILTEVIK